MTFAQKMNPIRDILGTIMKAAIITVAVVIGFGVGDALGLPVWLQGFFLIPAMLLFYRLSGDRCPARWKIFGFAALISIFVLLVTFAAKYFPEQDFWYYYVIILIVTPFNSILSWFERRLSPKKNKSEQVGDGDAEEAV